MKIIKIFLSSSLELKQERTGFELFISRMNNFLTRQNVYVELITCESVVSALSPAGSQDTINLEIRHCDLFVGIYTKTIGRFSEEEFDIALEGFKTGEKPKRIFTYFRETDLKSDAIDERLKNFSAKIMELNHYFTLYANIEGLILNFSKQFEKIKDAVGDEIAGYPSRVVKEIEKELANINNNDNLELAHTEIEKFLEDYKPVLDDDKDLKTEAGKVLNFIGFHLAFKIVIAEENPRLYEKFLEDYDSEDLVEKYGESKLEEAGRFIEIVKDEHQTLPESVVKKLIKVICNSAFFAKGNTLAGGSVILFLILISWGFSLFIDRIMTDRFNKENFGYLDTLDGNGYTPYWQDRFKNLPDEIVPDQEKLLTMDNSHKIFSVRFYQYRRFIHNLPVFPDAAKENTYKWHGQLFDFQHRVYMNHRDKYKDSFFSWQSMLFLRDTSAVFDNYFLLPCTYLCLFLGIFYFLRYISFLSKPVNIETYRFFSKNKSASYLKIISNKDVFLCPVAVSFIITAWLSGLTPVKLNIINSLGNLVFLFSATCSLITILYLIFVIKDIIKKTAKGESDQIRNKFFKWFFAFLDARKKQIATISIVFSTLTLVIILWLYPVVSNGPAGTIVDYPVHIQRIIRFFISVYGVIFIIFITRSLNFGIRNLVYKRKLEKIITLEDLEHINSVVKNEFAYDKSELKILDLFLMFFVFLVFSFAQAVLPIWVYVENELNLISIVIYVFSAIIIGGLVLTGLSFIPNMTSDRQQRRKSILIIASSVILIAGFILTNTISGVFYKAYMLLGISIIIFFLIIFPIAVYMKYFMVIRDRFNSTIQPFKDKANKFADNGQFLVTLDDARKYRSVRLHYRLSFILTLLVTMLLIVMYVVLPVVNL